MRKIQVVELGWQQMRSGSGNSCEIVFDVAYYVLFDHDTSTSRTVSVLRHLRYQWPWISIRGHSRSYILGVIESLCPTLYRQLIEILRVLYAKSRPLFPYLPLFQPKFWGVPRGVDPCCRGLQRAGELTNLEIIFKLIFGEVFISAYTASLSLFLSLRLYIYVVYFVCRQLFDSRTGCRCCHALCRCCYHCRRCCRRIKTSSFTFSQVLYNATLYLIMPTVMFGCCQFICLSVTLLHTV